MCFFFKTEEAIVCCEHKKLPSTRDYFRSTTNTFERVPQSAHFFFLSLFLVQKAGKSYVVREKRNFVHKQKLD